MLRKCALTAALLLVLAPGTARADWLFTPMAGSTFGADASGNEHLTYGASIGWMGAGVVGWEADLSYTPSFFDTSGESFDLTGGNNVASAMANAIFGVPIGGQRGGGFRPYAAVGVGLLRRQLETSDQLFSVSSNDFGFDAGVGAIGFVSDHVGIRGDVRYFRSLQDSNGGSGVDLDVGKFDFWRGTAGVTFRW